MAELIPIFGIVAGAVIAVAVFTWLYFESKHKRDALIELAQRANDPEQIADIVESLEEPRASTDKNSNKRGGLITLFVGIGLYLLGTIALGSVLQGVGALVGFIGAGVLLAAYLFPRQPQA